MYHPPGPSRRVAQVAPIAGWGSTSTPELGHGAPISTHLDAGSDEGPASSGAFRSPSLGSGGVASSPLRPRFDQQHFFDPRSSRAVLQLPVVHVSPSLRPSASSDGMGWCSYRSRRTRSQVHPLRHYQSVDDTTSTSAVTSLLQPTAAEQKQPPPRSEPVDAAAVANADPARRIVAKPTKVETVSAACTLTKARPRTDPTVWGNADSTPLLKTAEDYVNFLGKGVAMEAAEAARYDGNVVGRVCATYGQQDLEWIARVPDKTRKYTWAISGSSILQMAGLSALEVLLKAGFDPIHINHALQRGATFNVIVWCPQPEDLRAKRCDWDDVKSLIQDEYAIVWDLIAPLWAEVVSTPFYIQEINYDSHRGLTAMRNGSRGRRIQRKKDRLELWAATKLQARFRGNQVRHQVSQHEWQTHQDNLLSSANQDDASNEMITASKWRSQMIDVVSALKSPPATRTHNQIDCLMKWLRHIPFFRANVKTRTAMLQICQKLRHVEYMPGAVLVRQGEIGDDFYAIVKGTVAVWQSERNLGTMVLTTTTHDC